MSALPHSANTAVTTPTKAFILHVTNTCDSGVGSLRTAIVTANAGAEKTIIKFMIPPRSTIHIYSPLDTLRPNVTIDNSNAPVIVSISLPLILSNTGSATPNTASETINTSTSLKKP